jgi:hypothetical protein
MLSYYDLKYKTDVYVHRGFKIVADKYVSDYHWAKKSLIERLFCWPWYPWIATKIVHSPRLYIIESQKLVICSFATFKKLKEIRTTHAD